MGKVLESGGVVFDFEVEGTCVEDGSGNSVVANVRVGG